MQARCTGVPLVPVKGPAEGFAICEECGLRVMSLCPSPHFRQVKIQPKQLRRARENDGVNEIS